MDSQPGPRRRVIAPVTSGPDRGPKMGRMGIAILLLVLLVGLFLTLCGPSPQPRTPGALAPVQRPVVPAEPP